MSKKFEEFYEKFLAAPVSNSEKKYLKVIPKDSEEGKLYVKVQKEHLKKAFEAGQKAGL